MFRFFSVGNFELPFRLVQMKKYGLALQSVIGSISFAVILLSTLSTFPVSSIFTLWAPWVIVSFGLMEGNFKEHIFVDPKEYDNNYKSAFTCINAPSNALTFNTGYHIEHHEEPGLPWYQLPDLFLKNIEKHAANDSFVFDGIGSMEVGNLVLKKDFEKLADHYLNVGQPKRSRSQLIAEFKRRLLPIRVHCSPSKE
jgi:fatty acid desaturase